MTPNTLRFRARGDALVQHFEKLDANVKSFVGRKWLEVEPGRWGFVPSNADEEVPYRAEYVKACAEGSLYAADEETAKACAAFALAHQLPPVVFDPHFGSAPTRANDKPAPKADKPAASPAEKG